MNDDGREFDDSYVRQRNARCIQRMKNAIGQYRANELTLSSLISRIEVHVLDEQFRAGYSEDWIETIWDHWGDLETAHSFAVVAGEDLPHSNQRKQVYAAHIEAEAVHILRAVDGIEALLNAPDRATD